MAKPTAEKFVSPFGTARWPYLDVPDTEFDEKGVYHVGVYLPEEEIAAVRKKCDALFKKAFPDQKVKNFNYPIKSDKDDVEFLVAKSGYKPKVYDGKKKNLPKDVALGGGSRIRVAGELNAYVTGANKGVTLYLYDVQYTKLIAKGAGGALDEVDMDDADDDTEVDTDSNEGDGDLDI